MVKILNRLTIPAKFNVLNFLFILMMLSGISSMLITYYRSNKQLNAIKELTDFEVAIIDITDLSAEMRGDFFRVLAADAERQPKYIFNLYGAINDGIKVYNGFQRSAKSSKFIFTEEIETENEKLNSYLGKYFASCKDYSERLRDLSESDPAGFDKLRNLILDGIDERFIDLQKAENQLIPAIRKYKDSLMQEIDGERESSIWFFLTSGTALMFLLLVLVQYFKKSIVKPVKETEQILSKLSAGEPAEVSEYHGSDEFSEMLKSLMALTGHMRHIMKFVKNVAENNFDTEAAMFEGKGPIALSLMDMRDSLKASYTSENQRNWIAKGLAEFGNLVKKHEDLNTLYDKALSNIVKYLKANQGTLFLLDDDDKDNLKLVRVATYAYDRKKYISGVFGLNENLVGEVFLERELVCLKQVPDNYLQITSGLGEALPGNIIISPLISEEECLGVLEIAAFKEFNEKELEFIRRVGEELASVIKTVKINIRTQELLKESQQQTEALRTQEEEMRQNVEELTSTQEEMERRARELERANTQAEAQKQMMLKSMEKLKQKEKESQELTEKLRAQEEELRQNMEELQATQDVIEKRAKELERTNAQEEAQKQVLLKNMEKLKQKEKESQEQTEELRAQEEELRQNMEELQATQEEMERLGNLNVQIFEQASDAVITIDSSKKILVFNKAAEELFGYSREEVLGQNVKMVVPQEHRSAHDGYVDNNVKTSDNKLIGKARDLEMIRKDGTKFWGQLTLSKVEVGDDIRFTAFIKDVSDRKLLEKERQELAEELQATRGSNGNHQAK